MSDEESARFAVKIGGRMYYASDVAPFGSHCLVLVGAWLMPYEGASRARTIILPAPTGDEVVEMEEING